MLLTLPVADYRAAILEESEALGGFLADCAAASTPDGLTARRLRQILAPSDLDARPAAPAAPAEAPSGE